MFNMNTYKDSRSNDLDRNNKARKEFNEIEVITPLPLRGGRLRVLLGTVSMIAFLSAQHSVFAATNRFQDIEQRGYVSHRNPSTWEAFHEVQSSLENGHDGLNLVEIHRLVPSLVPSDPLKGTVLSVKSIDFSEWVQIPMSDVKDIPPIASTPPRRSKESYVLPIVSSTVVKPIGRVFLSTAKVTYYAIPHVASGSWWMVCKTAEALGATVSATNDATVYVVEAVRDVQAGRATPEEKGWDAGKKTASTIGNSFKWLGNTTVEGIEGAAFPLWNGIKYAAEETWENTKAAVHDMREAYLDDVGSSVKSTATKAVTYLEDKVSSLASKAKAAASNLASRIASGIKNIGSSIVSKASSIWSWLTS